MQDRQVRPAEKPPDPSASKVGESILDSPGEVVVTHHATPPETRDKQIHPRRPLPMVPAAPPRETESEKKDS